MGVLCFPLPPYRSAGLISFDLKHSHVLFDQGGIREMCQFTSFFSARAGTQSLFYDSLVSAKLMQLANW